MQPKETGIIMLGNHPKLILDGIKTQTRRVIKFEPMPNIVDSDWHAPFLMVMGKWCFTARFGMAMRQCHIKCPYGQVGDRLWVRETWASEKRYNNLKPSELPDTAKIYYVDKFTHSKGGYSLFTEMGKVRSAMFMCEWMSRITLEITEVRVERLQEISEPDIVKEGIEPYWTTKLRDDGLYIPVLYKEPFIRLWDSLNAKRGYGWETNPWVWVISFKMIRR